MSSFQKFLDYLFSLSSNERGRVFEHYCKWYLENDPFYKTQLKQVWLWRDWPDKWHPREKGADLIAETHGGELWAIQAKAYDAKYYVNIPNISKFLSESSRSVISHRLLIATTDRIGSNADELMNGQEKTVSRRKLIDLEESSLE